MGMGVLACQKGPWYILLLVKRGTEGCYLTKGRGVIACQKRDRGFLLNKGEGGYCLSKRDRVHFIACQRGTSGSYLTKGRGLQNNAI